MAVLPTENRALIAGLPQIALVEYVDSTSVAGGSVSDLIILNLYGINSSDLTTYPPTDLSGLCYAADLASIAIACSSTNYTLRIFTADDITAAGTINEVAVYSNINLSMSDIFSKFIIRNRDVPVLPRIYALIENNSGVATGDIYIELIYTPLSGRITSIF